MGVEKQILGFVAGLVGVVLLGGLAGAALGVELRGLREGNAALAREVEALTAELGDAPAGDVELQHRLQRQIELIGDLGRDRESTQVVLTALEDAFPTGTWLVRLGLDDDALRLHGRTRESEGVSLLMEGLQDSPCFTDVALRSVEGKTSADRVQSFWLEAKPGPPGCGQARPGLKDLFEPQDAEFQAIRVPKPPLSRWTPREYALVQVVPGEVAMLRDPEQGLHRVQVGSYVGSGRAKVTFITEDQVVLTEDVLLDEETRKTESRIINLGLER